KDIVQLTFAGQVSQETGEDWTDARLTLSTAEPATATVAPALPTWKIGERDRFIPTSMSAAPPTLAPPPVAPPSPLPRDAREEEGLRRRLLARLPAAPPVVAPTPDSEVAAAIEGVVSDETTQRPLAGVT